MKSQREVSTFRTPTRMLGRIIMDYSRHGFSDWSTLGVILVNLIILVDFFWGSLDLEHVLFIYLFQSAVYFFFFGISILSLRKFVGVDPRFPNREVERTFEGKGIRTVAIIFTAFFWLFYGIAHGALFNTLTLERVGLSFFVVLGLVVITSFFSFMKRFLAERERLETLSFVKSFFEPAMVLLPVYLGIIIFVIFAGIPIVGLLIFIFVKSWLDVIADSPLNVEEPFVYKILKEKKELEKR